MFENCRTQWNALSSSPGGGRCSFSSMEVAHAACLPQNQMVSGFYGKPMEGMNGESSEGPRKLAAGCRVKEELQSYWANQTLWHRGLRH
jgi:hypothetical protein